jgi:hypothetical protein
LDHLRKAFRDIAVGHSYGIFLSRPGYVKHLSYSDQISFDSVREEFIQRAKREGILTNDERLVQMKQRGEWSDAKEKEIRDCKIMIEGIIEGKKKNMNMPSLVKRYSEQLKEQEKLLDERLNAKYAAMGLTCEVYADREVNDQFIFSNLFKDKALETPLFSDYDAEYMTDSSMNQLVVDYNAAMDGCSTQNIKKLAMQGFFQECFALTGENISQFFGRPICHMTLAQVKLLSYARHFLNIYQNNDISKFPKNVVEDPDLLTDYAIAASKGKEEMQRQGAYEEGSVVVGAKKEDAKVLGIKQGGSAVADIMKNGGNFMDWAAKNAR